MQWLCQETILEAKNTPDRMKTPLGDWSNWIKLISLEKCQLFMRIDIKFVPISSVNDTYLIAYMKYKHM